MSQTKPSRKTKRLPRARYTQSELTEIFSRLREQRPEPKGELDHVNPFTLLVAVLQDIYHTQSELIVVFIGEAYEEKEWCGLEWRVIRNIIKQKESRTIMPIRMDDGDISGLFSIDGYIEGKDHSAEELANFILQRYQIEFPVNPPQAR